MKCIFAALGTLIALAFLAAAAPLDAATLYGATAAGGPGELYILNAATGAVIQDVGPLNNVASLNYPITGLAFHPTTGVLYGSTGNNSAATQARLVTINPTTAVVTEVGVFNAGPVNGSGTPTTMADIEFDPTGTLYGVGSIGGPQLYTINTTTGQATAVGGSGLTSTSGGGLGIPISGALFGTPTSSRFGTYNSADGTYTNIANPTRPLGGAYAALAADGDALYGLNLGPGTAFETRLVTFNLADGTVTELGASAARLDAITFGPTVPAPPDFDGDGVLGLADYLYFSSRLFINVTGLTVQQSLLQGDLTADLRIDGQDFVAFRTAFDEANGAGAFVAMLSAIPEPSTGLLAMFGALLIWRTHWNRRPRRGR